MAPPKKIVAAVQASLSRRLDEKLFAAIETTISENAPAPPTLDLETTIADCERMMREFRQPQIMFIVDRGMPGRSPCARRHAMANASSCRDTKPTLHQRWPIKIRRVISPEQANSLSRHLPVPPYLEPNDAQPSK